MIISIPTALYSSILPKTLTDEISVTWTISSQDPPRSSETLFQLLRSEQLRKLPPPIYDDQTRRASFGELIFRVATSGQQVLDAGMKSYEVGQVFDFGDIQEPSNIADLNVPSTVELQQNTNMLDLTSLGLSEEQSQQLVSLATEQFKESIISLNDIGKQINDIKSDISVNQKLINETHKALDAAIVVFGSSSDQSIIETLQTKEKELLAARDGYLIKIDELIASANEIYNRILDIREVVR